MKALALVPGSSVLRIIDRPEPLVTEANEVKVRVVRVGICGTDREEAAGGRARAPEGSTELVIGHEMLGQVVDTGSTVTSVKKGDYAVFTVRRGCGRCLSCAMNRPDMCGTGDYHERGIWGLDGYQSEFVVDREQYLVHVPQEIKDIGVLVEPLSIAEKAIDEVFRLQSVRLPDAPAELDWFSHKRCIVAGLGPVGMLAAMALRLRGSQVFGIDVVDEGTTRPEWLAHIGGKYVDGRRVTPAIISKELGQVDVIFEATGVASLEFNLLDALGLNGAYVLTGIPGGDRPLQIQGAELIRRLVLGNQLMVGSVNASRDHFQIAVRDLSYASLRWGDHISRLITHRHHYSDFGKAFERHDAEEIKAVIEWSS
jgi:threonine dehydrogenase-like Zn-dependent dehydrogenase